MCTLPQLSWLPQKHSLSTRSIGVKCVWNPQGEKIIQNYFISISPKAGSHFKTADFCKQDNKALLQTAANIIKPSQISKKYLLLKEMVNHSCLKAKTRLQKVVPRIRVRR